MIVIAIIFPRALFILWILIAPIISLILFPFYITAKFIDILYPALLLSTLLSVSLAISIKNKANVKLRFTVLISSILFVSIYFPISKYLGESYIRNTAIEKYNQEAKDVRLNLKSWYKVGPSDFIGLPGHGRHLGNSHGYIYIDSCKSNWSFFKRDYIKANHCDDGLNKKQ